MITVTELQEQARAAELHKRRRRSCRRYRRPRRTADHDERTARKATSAHGIEGPGEGVMPGHPEPEHFDRTYLEHGHAAESPMADLARVNPMPLMQHRACRTCPVRPPSRSTSSRTSPWAARPTDSKETRE